MNDIEEVKNKLNIVDIIGARVQLKKAGRNFKGLCPFHNEKTPSFMVSPERQMFHCFGCGKGGSVIDFVMEYERMDFGEALETLADQAGVKLEKRTVEQGAEKEKRRMYEVNHIASEYYHYILTKHALGENARVYLKKRGVSDKTADTFSLGYSPNSWDGLTRYLRKKGYDDQFLDRVGLAIKSNRGGYDRFRGRVMFALRDHRGNVVGFSGRLLDQHEGQPADRQEAKYINTSETPIYSKSNVLYGLDITKTAIQKAGEAILMEGEFDVISSFQAGVGNVVAIKGSALTEGHVNLLRRYTDRLSFALDSDMAGDAAARRGIEIAERAGLDLNVVVIPNGKDPDDAVREDAIGFRKAIEKPIPIYDYYIHSAVKRFETGSAFGKKKIGEELLPLFARIENPIVQAHYMKKLAQTLDVSEQTIADGIRKVSLPKPFNKKIDESPAPEPREDKPEKFELYILALILQAKTREFMEEFTEVIPIHDIHHPGVAQILTVLRDTLSRSQQFFITDFATSLPKELHSVLDEAFLWDLSSFIDNDELVAREWMRTLRETRRLILKRKIRAAITKLEQAEAGGQGESVLQKDLTELTGQLRVLEKLSDL